MRMSDIDEASETGDVVRVSGESPVACVANERRDASGVRVPGAPPYGRWALRPLLRSRARQIVASIDAATACPACADDGEDIMFLGGKQLDVHLQKEHPTTSVEWKCERCVKTFPKLHAWRCHFAKCKGELVNPPTAFECELCGAGFETKIGLSQHERHAHPNVRNAKRAAASDGVQAKSGKKLSVWTQSELDLLEKLNFEHRTERNINVKLMEFFPGKTNKQIGEARRRFKHDKTSRTEPEHMDESGSSEAIHESIPELNADEIPIVFSSAENKSEIEAESCNWKDKLKQEALKYYDSMGPWETWFEKFKALATDNVDSEILENAYNEFEKALNLSSGNDADNNLDEKNNTRKKTKRPNRARPPNRSQRKKFAYAKCRELMDKCPKKLADAVVANDLSLLQIRGAPNLAETRELYQKLWGTTGPQQEPYSGTNVQVNTEEVLLPITPAEVAAKLRRIANSSAAGPDGITKADLRKKGTCTILSKFFNIFLMQRFYPTAWRSNRTTLIPKSDKDINNIKNWRPITISSIINRIFSSLLDKRLRRIINQTERQKGFTAENGCYSNVQLLNQAIHVAKNEGGVITVLDISKAFDTVPHGIIKGCLERKGIPPLVANYIMHSYEKCVTTIKTHNGKLPIEIRRGVKQGDPLSPLLFNLSIEPIIDSI